MHTLGYVPTMVVDLLAETSTASKNLSSLKVIFGGGAPMPESVAQELYDRVSGSIHGGIRHDGNNFANPYEPAGRIEKTMFIGIRILIPSQ